MAGGTAPRKARIAQVGAEDALPLRVVDRGAAPNKTTSRAKVLSLIWRLRYLVVFLLLPIGAVIGLYFQPPGAKLLMQWLDLQPGGGTSKPIAVPALRPETAALQDGTFNPGGMLFAQTVAGLGLLVPAGDVLTIAPPFGASDARIAVLWVEEGYKVEKGAVLGVLDNEASFKAAVASAQATVAAREAALAQAKDNVVFSRDESRASLSRAESAVVSAKRDFDRARELQAKGFSTDVSYDQKRLTYEQAVKDVERAKATLARYEFTSIDEQADVILARRNLESAQAELARAEADLEKAYVRAPIAGTVLTIHVRAGEKPGSDGILSLGDIDKMTAELEIYQTLIGLVAVGQSVSITADALPNPLTGTVSRVGLEVGRQSLTDASPAANTDARVVKVYVDLDAPSAATARRFTNLQVTARIATGANQ